MRLLLQRVTSARVDVENQTVGEIGTGLLVFLGFSDNDTDDCIPTAISKLLNLRIFADEAGKLNLSVTDICGGILLISQFTLYANCSRGRRPDFSHAASPDKARSLYNEFVRQLNCAHPGLQTGIFAADMKVSLLNDGPISIILDF